MWLVALLIACRGSGLAAAEDTSEAFAWERAAEQTCAEPFRACGGEADGDWELLALCDPGLDASALGCPEATWVVTKDRSLGRLELGADGSFVRVYEIDVDYDLFVPEDCLGPLSCGALPAVGGLVEGCEQAKHGCLCNGTMKQKIRNEGAWDAKGGDVVTDDGRTEVCVDGQRADTVDEDGVRVIWRR